MYVGAGISAVSILFVLLQRDEIRDAIEDSQSDLTADEVDAAASFTVGVLAIILLAGVGLWLWMAATNKKGKSWARIVATVFGGLNIVYTLFGLGANGGISLVFSLISVALAGAILWLLYRKDSSEYYAAVSARGRGF